MNIIKFKDTVVEGQSWYNQNLRGKYAYWIRCHYVVPIESINPNMYVSFETTINNLLGYNYYHLTTKNDELVYELLDERDLSVNAKHSIPLVESLPEPTSTSPAYVKTQSNIIKYVDLWEGDYYWMNSYIDLTKTDEANNVDFYKSYNTHVIESDVVQEDVERFRTWLDQLLIDVNYEYYKLVNSVYVLFNPTLDEKHSAVLVDELPDPTTENPPLIVKLNNLNVIDWTDDQKHVLDYYANNMYDDVLKWTLIYGKREITTTLTTNTLKNCGCSGGSDISSLYNSVLHVCNPESIYRAGLKQGMVEILTDIDIWNKVPATLKDTIIKYLSAIIQLGLNCDKDPSSDIYNCECLNNTSADSLFTQSIKQLIQAFEYLRDEDITNHKNYIYNTLSVWANDYYEKMQWK